MSAEFKNAGEQMKKNHASRSGEEGLALLTVVLHLCRRLRSCMGRDSEGH